MRGFLSFIISLLFLNVYGQAGKINGRVFDSATGEPIANANVFLSSGSKGTRSDENGFFSLNNISPGQYELIASFTGYETSVTNVSVSDNLQMLQLQMKKKNVQLPEVVISNSSNWERNYRIFKRVFIGNSSRSELCSIVNPEVLTFEYDQDSAKLAAASDGFLIIENRVLGYRLKYLLTDFEYSERTSFIYYSGHALFEELPAGATQLKQWKKSRRAAYLGSSIHFYRTIISNRILENGFLVRSLLKAEPANSLSPEDRNHSQHKSIRLAEAGSQPRMLMNEALSALQIARRTNLKEIFALTYHTDLHVTFKPNKRRDAVPPSAEISAIITFKDPPVLFDLNGIVINSRSVIYSGDWSRGIADMLPHDYR